LAYRLSSLYFAIQFVRFYPLPLLGTLYPLARYSLSLTPSPPRSDTHSTNQNSISLPRDKSTRLHTPGHLPSCSHLRFHASFVSSLNNSLQFQSLSGDEGTRTPDFRLAKAALSQLSYIPKTGKWAFQDSNLRPLPYQRNALTN
jgi:hypothetical protein